MCVYEYLYKMHQREAVEFVVVISVDSKQYTVPTRLIFHVLYSESAPIIQYLFVLFQVL